MKLPPSFLVVFLLLVSSVLKHWVVYLWESGTSMRDVADFCIFFINFLFVLASVSLVGNSLLWIAERILSFLWKNRQKVFLHTITIGLCLYVSRFVFGLFCGLALAVNPHDRIFADIVCPLAY